MKESWQNLKKAAAITIGLASGFNVKAQATQSPESNIDSTKIGKVISQEQDQNKLDTTFNLQEIYDKNKVENDKSFGNYTHYLEKTSNGDRVKFRFENLLNEVYISVTNRGGEEVFQSLDELGKKYPNYSESVKFFFSTEYPRHKDLTTWSQILNQKKQTLSNDFTNYVPNQEEIDFVKSLVEKKNSGENLDGFDDILNYINDKEGIGSGPDTDHPQAIYNFYEKYDGTPNDLAGYLTEKYFKPFVNK